MATKGVSVRVLAALAGHSSIVPTQRYIDIYDDMLKKAAKQAELTANNAAANLKIRKAQQQLQN